MGTARFVPELLNPYCVASALCNSQEKTTMAAAKKTAKKTARGRAQDRTKVAGGQRYEVSYEAKKTGRSAPAVKKAVKKVGNVRKTVEKRLSGKRK
jgi:Protein of unknown function (DUF3606)